MALEYLCSASDVDSLVVSVRFRVEGQTFGGPSVETVGLEYDSGLVQGAQASIVSVGKLIHQCSNPFLKAC